MKWLLDPNIFNYVIMVLYILNTARWTYEHDWGQAVYWFGATLLTGSVIFMLNKG